MILRSALTLLCSLPLVLAASAPARAQDLSPGSWEISLEARVAASPGFAPPPYKLTQCLSAQDARDPARLLGSLANPGATGCTFGNSTFSGNQLTFTMQCAGTFDLHAQGAVSFSPTSMDGTITSTSVIGGQNVEMQSKVSARRLGNC
jgi:hypothetical protein